MDAFDADVLIYAAAHDHPLGRPVRELFVAYDLVEPPTPSGVGSVLLIPEVLSKPMQQGDDAQLDALSALLSRLQLRDADRPTVELATAYRAQHGLKTADAVHLATAVLAGADRFITNNSRDFPTDLPDIDVVFPGDLDIGQ